MKNEQNLFEDLNQKDAETISGGILGSILGKIPNPLGKETFTVSNETNDRIPYTVDWKQTTHPYPGSSRKWSTRLGGYIRFDYDTGRDGVQKRTYNLKDGHKYAFRYDTRTAYAHDIELYDIT
ncbi:MAG: hypothetical protein AAFW67_06935 [Cyanobacteria bacterium J06638_38]